ncbi:DUF5955 family protein [Nonomuraea sp. NPDC046802]|uniref:DUF5955 family protein n=1 Tax=Nonomuraea sp. NPDC046802 TaxID=3154919 RepID=UPI0033D1A36E
MTDPPNINITGSQGINFGTVSGQGANFGGTVNYYTNNQLQTLITDLKSAISNHRAELPNPEETATAVELLEEEAAADTPRPNRLTTFLNTLTASAGGITAITEAATKIKDLLSSMG